MRSPESFDEQTREVYDHLLTTMSELDAWMQGAAFRGAPQAAKTAVEHARFAMRRALIDMTEEDGDFPF